MIPRLLYLTTVNGPEIGDGVFVYCLVFVLHTFVCESTVARIFNMAVFLVYTEVSNWLSRYAGNYVSFLFYFLNLYFLNFLFYFLNLYVEAMLNFYDLSFVFLQKFPVIMLQTVKSWLQMLVLDRLLDVKYFCKKKHHLRCSTGI